MILYEYYCNCGREKEVYHGMDETPVVKCDECQWVMKKKITTTPFILRGEGWGKDGYVGHTRMQRGSEYDSYKAARNAHEKVYGKMGIKE